MMLLLNIVEDKVMSVSDIYVYIANFNRISSDEYRPS